VQHNVEAMHWSFDFPAVLSRQIRLLIFGSADQWARILEVQFGRAGSG